MLDTPAATTGNRSNRWRAATSARVHDHWLSGKDHHPGDRYAADAMAAVAPWVEKGARASRAFLRRAVIHLSELGIDQFLDLGCGLPHNPNVHQIAQVRNPKAVVTYVDRDPVVVAHARALLATDQRTIAIQADVRDPHDLIAHLKTRPATDGTTRPLDLTRPVAILMVGLLEHLTDAEAADLLHVLRQAAAAGSSVAIAHTTADPNAFDRHWQTRGSPTGPDAQAWQQGTTAAADIYRRLVGPLHLRTRQQIHDLFHGYDLLRPGLLPAVRWRAPGVRGPVPVPVLAGVGRLPRGTTPA